MNERYDRNIRLSGFGEAGQARLSRAHALVVGAGGLGSPAILYLAAAGVGKITVADGDTVSLSNLQRQILYTEHDIGKNKAEAAALAVRRLNADVTAVPLHEHLTRARMETLFPACHCVLDCTDRAETKYELNDVCVKLGVPYVHAGVLGMAGQLLSYAPGHACLRCVLPEPQKNAPTASELGILGAAAGVLGSLQAAEAVKILAGLGEPLYDTLLHIDIGSGEVYRVHIERSPACPACGTR